MSPLDKNEILFRVMTQIRSNGTKWKTANNNEGF
jgi:hypothetical protein